MANPITIVNDTISQAPAPSTLQKTGAIVSQGGTTTASGTLTLLTSVSSLATILTGAAAVSSISQTGGTATATTTAAHGLPVSEQIEITIAGAVPTAYNGTFLCTITGANTFTYSVPSGTSSPATGTIVYTVADVAELVAMNATFFAQTGIKSVYVLELGEGNTADGIAALNTWIGNNPGRVYSFLVPEEWDGDATFVPMLRNYTATDKRTYFFVTTTTGNQAKYAGLKCVHALVPALAAPASEFTEAWPFNQTLGWAPSSTQQVPPLEYVFGFGVTPWPSYGEASTFAGFATNNINYAGSGVEGGLSNVILFGGNLQDGNPFNFWYSIDWVSINADLVTTNIVINGSNAIPYLYYNQPGINRLQAGVRGVMASAVSYGLAVGQVVTTQLPFQTFAQNLANGVYAGQAVVNAEPFSIYTKENPGDYAIGKYGGLAIAYAPQRGFDQVIINVNASTFVS